MKKYVLGLFILLALLSTSVFAQDTLSEMTQVSIVPESCFPNDLISPLEVETQIAMNEHPEFSKWSLNCYRGGCDESLPLPYPKTLTTDAEYTPEFRTWMPNCYRGGCDESLPLP